MPASLRNMLIVAIFALALTLPSQSFAVTIGTALTSSSTIGDLDADSGKVAWLESEAQSTADCGFAHRVMYTSLASPKPRKAGCASFDSDITDLTVDGTNVGWWEASGEVRAWTLELRMHRMFTNYNPLVDFTFSDSAPMDADLTTSPPDVGLAGARGTMMAGVEGAGIAYAFSYSRYASGFTPLADKPASSLVAANDGYFAAAAGSTITVRDGQTLDATGTVRDIDINGQILVASVDTTDTPAGRRLLAWNLDTLQLMWQRNVPGSHSDITTDGRLTAYRTGKTIVVRNATTGATTRTITRTSTPRFIRLDAGKLIFAENISGNGYVRIAGVG